MGFGGDSIRDHAHGKRIVAGDTADISLPTLLHLLEIENINGRLHLGDEATIRLYRGLAVDAALGPLRGRAALRELLFRDSWSFEVICGPSDPEPPIPRLPMLIMEALHLREEWSRMAGNIYRLVGDQRWCPTGAPVDVYMDLIDGSQELRQIAAKVGAPTTILVEGVLEALTLGLIEQVERPQRSATPSAPPSPPSSAQGEETEARPEPPPTHALAPEDQAYIATADFDDLLGFARRSIRRGDLATAEAAVRAALHLEPESRIAQQNLRRLLQLRAT